MHQAKTESMESRGCRPNRTERTSLSGSTHTERKSTETETVKRCIEQIIPQIEQRKETSRTQVYHCDPVGRVI